MPQKKRKAQMSFMIIIGLVILILISFVVYLVSSTTKKQIGKEASQAKQARMNVQPIIEYVNQCLDKTSRESLSLTGKQAGYIFESQGGLKGDFGGASAGIIFLEFNDLNVAYFITNDFLDNPSVYPNYPWTTFPYDKNPATDAAAQLKLIYSNPPLSLDPSLILFGTQIFPELFKSIALSDSIQANLESYVKNKMIECANFNVFQAQGYDIAADSENIIVNATIGLDDVAFRLSYPLTIKYFDEKTMLKDFSKKQKVRLAKIYNEVQRITIADKEDITYNIETPSAIDGIEIAAMRDAGGLQGKDDIIRVIDTESKILNENFEFVFARQNRKPALHYIPNATINQIPTSITLRQPYGTDDSLTPSVDESAQIDDEDELKIALNKSLKIKDFNPSPLLDSPPLVLNASDPDEDELTYDVAGRFDPLVFPLTPTTPSPDGVYNILVSVDDGQFIDAYDPFTYYVTIDIT